MATKDQQFTGRLYTQAEVDALSKPPTGLGEYTDSELLAELIHRGVLKEKE